MSSPSRDSASSWAARTAELEAIDAYDQFGAALYAFARVLVQDDEMAGRLVIQTIVAHRSGPSTLNDLAASVHAAWLAWGPSPQSHSPLRGAPSAEELTLHDLRALPDDQRAAMGLCRYGSHTYRQAAVRLDLSPQRVADLLIGAMRTLAVPCTSCSDPARVA